MDEKNNKDRKLSHIIVVILLTASIISIYIYNEVLNKEDEFELEYDWNYYGAIAEISSEFTTNITLTKVFFDANNFTEISSGLNNDEPQLYSSAKLNVNGNVVTVVFLNMSSTQNNTSHLDNNISFTVNHIIIRYYSQNSQIFDTIQEVESSPQYISDKEILEAIAQDVSHLIGFEFGTLNGAIEITPLITYLH